MGVGRFHPFISSPARPFVLTFSFFDWSVVIVVYPRAMARQRPTLHTIFVSTRSTCAMAAPVGGLFHCQH
jgi:hypothetical protein